jgi:DNA (cytosine-5)-methyltransferase 1
MSSNRPSEPIQLPANSSLLLLQRVRQRYTQKAIGTKLDVSAKTVARWERRETPCPVAVEAALQNMLAAPASEGPVSAFTFIDLFAGIGGIRLGFQSAGGKCVFTSEWNEWSKKTYLENFPGEHPFVGDIVPYPAENVPDHDVLLAGFPCQPFSLAGVSKKNSLGRPHGFECTTQGTLFFDVARIIAAKQPKAFLLENVKNLVSHDGGNTFRVIIQTLQEELGYDVHWKVIDAKPWRPQHRERLLIAGFREKSAFSWDEIRMPAAAPVLSSILHPEDGTEQPEDPYTTGAEARVHRKYVLTDKLWAYLQAYADKHKAAGNGFGFGLVTRDMVARTLSARYYKDGSEILVKRARGANPRRLTPRECARLMGFPDTFRIPVSDTQAYRQFGNSVVVPVMKEAARIMAPHVLRLKQQAATGAVQEEIRFASNDG